MADRHWRDLFGRKWSEGNFACVGLDPDFDKIPEHLKCLGSPEIVIGAFNRAIVDATKDVAGAYKPQSAFYEAFGEGGLRALKMTIDHIHDVSPDVPVILDAKRGDIGNTNNGYVKMAFDFLGVDGITLHNYLGQEAMKPFLAREDKLSIFMCKTSNKGAGEFQDLGVAISREEARFFGFKYPLDLESDEEVRAHPPTSTLYKHVAYQVSKYWNTNDNCGLVVGATYPDELKYVREIVGTDFPILIPGIGAQGGDLEAAVRAGKDANGSAMIINSSSGIIFASKGDDFAEAARAKAIELRDGIRAALAA